MDELNFMSRPDAGGYLDDFLLNELKKANNKIMNSVVAKFTVGSITRAKGWYGANDEVQTIHLSPVTGGTGASEENKKFWAATPSGKIEIGIVNKDTGSYFELGEEYLVTFTKAPK